RPVRPSPRGAVGILGAPRKCDGMVCMNGDDRGRRGGPAAGRPAVPQPRTAVLPGGIPQSWPPPAQSAPPSRSAPPQSPPFQSAPPPRSSYGAPPSARPPFGRSPGRRRPGRWRRRIGALLLVLLVLIVGFAVYIDFSLGRTD